MINSKAIYILLLFGVLLPHIALSQEEYTNIRKGNDACEENNFKEAEIEYRKSLSKNYNSFQGSFNLGIAMYRQEEYEEALKYFLGASTKGENKEDVTNAYYNMGNALFKAEKYKESIEAYKSALRSNPAHEDSRYNLAYAQKKLSEQQEEQQEQDQQEQEQEQDQQEQEQEQQEQQQEQQEQQEEAQEQNISKEDAERMLEALQNNEKETLNKLNLKKSKSSTVTIEKDW